MELNTYDSVDVEREREREFYSTSTLFISFNLVTVTVIYIGQCHVSQLACLDMIVITC